MYGLNSWLGDGDVNGRITMFCGYMNQQEILVEVLSLYNTR
jgi:hypothetical protein